MNYVLKSLLIAGSNQDFKHENESSTNYYLEVVCYGILTPFSVLWLEVFLQFGA